jgi:molybdenum cofactor synthesis domain-containing protein
MPGFGVVTVSDRCAAGKQADTTGPAVARLLAEAWPEETIGRGLVPDNEDAIETLLHELCHQEYQLILTAGGTGLGPRDVTPEATRRVIEREVPGLAEAMRAECAPTYRFAWLSRAVAGLCRTILPLLPHALEVIAGGQKHPASLSGIGLSGTSV